MAAPALERARFIAARSERDLIGGEACEQGETRPGTVARDGEGAIGPSEQGVEGALKAESVSGKVVSECGFEDEGTDEVISDSVHPQLSFDDFRGEAAQDIEGEVGLDLPEMQFDLPTAGIELGDGVVGEGSLIEQGSDHDHAFGAEAAGADTKAHEPHDQFGRKSVPVREARATLGFIPNLPPRAMTARAHETDLMQTDDKVGLLLL